MRNRSRRVLQGAEECLTWSWNGESTCGCSGRQSDRPRRTAEAACAPLMILPNRDALGEKRFAVRIREGYT